MGNNRKPSLTAKVMRGLIAMAGAIDASPHEVLMGVESEDDLDAEGRRTMDDYAAAVRWIRRTNIHRGQAKRERETAR